MQRAHEVLFYVGLGEARYRNVETYSTGMKQRIKLAQALVHDPDLLFLDEPTNGMDPKGREEMLELVRLSGFGGRRPAQLSGGQRQRAVPGDGQSDERLADHFGHCRSEHSGRHEYRAAGLHGGGRGDGGGQPDALGHQRRVVQELRGALAPARRVRGGGRRAPIAAPARRPVPAR